METVLERSHVLGGSELKLEPFRIEEPPEVIAIVIANCLPKQFREELEFESAVFCGEGKPGYPEKNFSEHV